MATSNQGFSWIPRILTMLIILFISVFATDSFTGEANFIQQLSEFLVHLTPSLILIVFLIIAWKRELIGGVLFVVFSLIMSPFVYSMNYERTHSMMMSLGVILIITLPILVAGILFIISSGKKQKTLQVK